MLLFKQKYIALHLRHIVKAINNVTMFNDYDFSFNKFREKYDATLPDGWMNLIEDNPHFFTIAKDSLMDRVYPNLQGQKTNNGTSEQKAKELDELVLPWNEKHWNVFVTSVSTTVDIWGRLIGPDFSVCAFFFRKRNLDKKKPIFQANKKSNEEFEECV